MLHGLHLNLAVIPAIHAGHNALHNAQCDVFRLAGLGILAHIDAGKTSVTENLLFASGATETCGRVDNGDTLSLIHISEMHLREGSLVADRGRHNIGYLKAVSYTHLDVYKRQFRRRRLCRDMGIRTPRSACHARRLRRARICP